MPNDQQPEPDTQEIAISHDHRVGALIDSARISLNTALYLIDKERRVVTAEPTDLEKMIDQSLGWADSARMYVVQHMDEPQTSIHIIKP
jgi:hypothetical protein